jgi:hypothetical protein
MVTVCDADHATVVPPDLSVRCDSRWCGGRDGRPGCEAGAAEDAEERAIMSSVRLDDINHCILSIKVRPGSYWHPVATRNSKYHGPRLQSSDTVHATTRYADQGAKGGRARGLRGCPHAAQRRPPPAARTRRDSEEGRAHGRGARSPPAAALSTRGARRALSRG